MKYISYTFVDDATQIPVSIEPARKGPIMPEGVGYVFSIEDSFSTGVPSFFGVAEDNYSVKDWMVEYSFEQWLEVFKSELNTRACKKRQSLISQGFVEEGDIFFDYSKSTLDGLYCVINTMMLDQDISDVDFKIRDKWIVLNIQRAREILVSINKSIQLLFSWECEMSKDISYATSLDELKVVQDSITQYTGQSNDS